jgi:hypothetical protein
MVSGEAQSGSTGAWDGSDAHPARCLMSKRAQPQIPHLHATGRHPGDVLTYSQPLPWAYVRTRPKVFRNHGPGDQKYSHSNDDTMVPGDRIDSLYPDSRYLWTQVPAGSCPHRGSCQEIRGREAAQTGTGGACRSSSRKQDTRLADWSPKFTSNVCNACGSMMMSFICSCRNKK